MSTIQCPRCGSVFPLAQVAQFDQFTCGACQAIVPVPAAAPFTPPPVRPVPPAAPPTVALSPQQIRATLRSAQPAPIPAHAPARPQAVPARPGLPAQGLPPAAQRAAQPRAAAPATPGPQARAVPGPSAPSPRPATSAAQSQRAAASAPPPAATRPTASARPAAAVPVRTRPSAAPVEVEVEDAGDEESPRRGRRGERAAKKKPAGLYVGIGLGAVAVVGVLMFALRKGDTPAEQNGTTQAGGGPVATAPDKPAADPDKDPAAWKSLAEDDRKTRSGMKLARLDGKDAFAAQELFNFFKARDENDAATKVAEEVLRVKPETEWAHLALGHKDLRERVDACVRDAQWSDGLGTEAMKTLQTLRKTKAPKSGPWFGDDAAAKLVDDLIAQILEEEKSLSTPFGQGVAKWVNYHRSIEVMRDFPALHGTVGPYLVFVSLPVPKEKEGKDVTIADVAPADVERGRKLLESNLALYGAFYDGWHEILGPILGIQRYGPDNADQTSTLLVNVFTKEEDYRRYNARTGGPGGGARAYYSQREPRFIVTYDGPPTSELGKELGEDTARVQCHEGTHQLMHFYTWDLVRKANPKPPEMLAVASNLMWISEGFAEFFASYRKDGDRYVWMQPLDDRMSDIWVISHLLKARKWEDWKLREILEPYHNGQLTEYGRVRARQGESDLAISAMSNLYYGKAWSLCYYLWYSEEGGKPKFRDRFQQYLKFEFTPQLVTDLASGRQFARTVTPDDFRKAFGLTDQPKFDAFEKEWRAWETKFLADHKTAAWDKKKQILWKLMNLNDDGTSKKAPPQPPKK